MKTCKDCIYRAMCYKHEHYGYEDEQICEMFKNKADFVEVVRCENCKYRKTHTCAITGIETLFCDYGNTPVAVEPEHFCSYGERSDT